MRFRPLVRIGAAAACALLLASCSDSATTPFSPPRFGTTYVFGASLDDTGNACNLSATACPPAPPYATGKYSNGQLWVEIVAQNYGGIVAPARIGGTNYAFAGARTGPIAGTVQAVPNMMQQVDLFLAAPTAVTGNRATALFIIDAATVGNDINDALVQGRTNPAAPATIIAGAVTNAVSMVTRLYAAGARNILLVNSTDIGRTPLVRAQGQLAIATATALSTQFNTALASQLAAVRSASAGLNLILFDLGAFSAEVFANPATFGFTSLSTPCFVSPAVPLCTTPNAFFFWDGFHPTAATGRWVSQRVIGALTSAQ